MSVARSGVTAHRKFSGAELCVILLGASAAVIASVLQEGSLTQAIIAGLLVAALAAIGVWVRRGPLFWVFRRWDIKVRGDSPTDLSRGRHQIVVELLPRLSSARPGSIDIRFVDCATLWRDSPPVSGAEIEITNCQWNRRSEEEHIRATIKAEDYSGGFRLTFTDTKPEFKTDVGLRLHLTVRASEDWSGYLSTEWRIPGKPKRSYGRKRASIGEFKWWSVRWKCLKNQIVRLQTYFGKDYEPSPARERETEEHLWQVQQMACLWFEGLAPTTQEAYEEMMTPEIATKKRELHNAIDQGRLDLRREEGTGRRWTRWITKSDVADYCAREGCEPWPVIISEDDG